MSALAKVNVALVSVLISALGSASFVVWQASAKASDIEFAKKDIGAINEKIKVLDQSDKENSRTLERLDERTIAILRLLEGRK